jgi:hypothetical protein
VGTPRGLGKPIAGAGVQHRLHGSIQTDPIALGDEDRRNPMSCPEHSADLFAAIEEGLEASATFPWLPVRTHQEALGAADRRPTE